MDHPENPIRIGEHEYQFEDLPPRAQTLITYLQSIDKNLDTLEAQMDMIQITRVGCYTQLSDLMEIYDATQEPAPGGGIPEEPAAA